jgi:hypothetical protein
MNCEYCEERISDYLENALSLDERTAVNLHLQTCSSCNDLLIGVRDVLVWGKSFPVYEAPAWLPPRIVANTPRIAREKWTDTVGAVWRWIIEPRTAMAVFTTILVLGWLGNLAGLSPNFAAVIQNPTGIYYGAQGVVNRAYGEAVRRYYRSPLVTEIQTRIQQLREIS